jgi:hypothetical protein
MRKPTLKNGTQTLWVDLFAKTADVTPAVGRAKKSRLQFACTPDSDIMHECITSDAETAEQLVG